MNKQQVKEATECVEFLQQKFRIFLVFFENQLEFQAKAYKISIWRVEAVASQWAGVVLPDHVP